MFNLQSLYWLLLASLGQSFCNIYTGHYTKLLIKTQLLKWSVGEGNFRAR